MVIGRPVPPRVRHLTGDGPLPDHLEQPELVALQLAPQRFRQPERMSGRSNGLVGFLGVLHFRRVGARLVGQILAAILRFHQFARRINGHLGEIGRVGTHVRDVAVLVQALRHLHRAPRGETEFAVGLLLHRARRERRRRPHRVRFVVQRRRCGTSPAAAARPTAGPAGRRATSSGRLCSSPGPRVEIPPGRDPASVDGDQIGLERPAGWPQTCPTRSQ